MNLRSGLEAEAWRVFPSGSRASIIFILRCFSPCKTAGSAGHIRAEAPPLNCSGLRWLLPLNCYWQESPWVADGLGYQLKYRISLGLCYQAFSWIGRDRFASFSGVVKKVLGPKKAFSQVSKYIFLHAVCFASRHARMYSYLELCFALVIKLRSVNLLKGL